MSDVTQVLNAIEQGDPKAATQLLPLVYEELRNLAASTIANKAPGQPPRPPARVHAAWRRLPGGAEHPWDSRAFFSGAAAEAMRGILTDKARRKKALRHGAGQARLDVQDVDIAAPGLDDQLLA